MFTPTEITAGATRLVADKLTAKDINSIISAFRKYFKHLETVHSYTYQADLEALDDSDNDAQVCAEIGACLNKMEEFTWGSAARLAGGPDAVNFEENSRYFEYVGIIFTKLYAWPEEMSANGVIRRVNSTRYSQTARLIRDESCGVYYGLSESELRRRSRRCY